MKKIVLTGGGTAGRGPPNNGLLPGVYELGVAMKYTISALMMGSKKN